MLGARGCLCECIRTTASVTLSYGSVSQPETVFERWDTAATVRAAKYSQRLEKQQSQQSQRGLRIPTPPPPPPPPPPLAPPPLAPSSLQAGHTEPTRPSSSDSAAEHELKRLRSPESARGGSVRRLWLPVAGGMGGSELYARAEPPASAPDTAVDASSLPLYRRCRQLVLTDSLISCDWRRCL